MAVSRHQGHGLQGGPATTPRLSRRWRFAAATLAFGAQVGLAAAQGPEFGGPAFFAGPAVNGGPVAGMGYGGPMPAGQADPRVRMAALSSPDKRPLPPQIAEMPQVREEMEVIHHRSQLIVGRDRIARTAVADSSVVEIVRYSENEIDVIGLAMGSTTLTIWFENDPEPLIYLVTVIRDPGLDEQRRIDYGKLERKLQNLFPNSNVYLVPLSYKIIVKGQARDAEEAAKILEVVQGEIINQQGALGGPQPQDPAVAGGVGYGNGYGAGLGGVGGYGVASSFVVNMLEVPGERQVMIHVRIAELKRAQLRRMGVDIGFLINGGRQAFNYVTGGVPTAITGILNNGEVNVLINWLASNGTGKILSEPSLAVISGHPASFLSGGEFAVPTIVGVNGVGGQQTTFRGYGTSLIVTPFVVDKDLIRLRIVPEFSQIDASTSVGGIPGLSSRRVQTTVELREGQTIAIAGLIGRQSATEVSRIPFLGDLPLVGPILFAGKRATEDESELLILVTPELVRPMDPDEVPPMPGYYVTHPNDSELYCYGMTEGVPDLGVYQVGPIGRAATYGREVGYHVFEPAPATPLYSPSTPYPNGNVAPLPAPPTAGRMPGNDSSSFGPPSSVPPGYDQPPVPPGYGLPPGAAGPFGRSSGIPGAPASEPAGSDMMPVRPRADYSMPAGPVPALPAPAYGPSSNLGPSTNLGPWGSPSAGVQPAGYQQGRGERDANASRGGRAARRQPAW